MTSLAIQTFDNKGKHFTIVTSNASVSIVWDQSHGSDYCLCVDKNLSRGDNKVLQVVAYKPKETIIKEKNLLFLEHVLVYKTVPVCKGIQVQS